jgi:MFS family permease
MARSRLALVPSETPAPAPGQRALIWTLGLGAFGLAWSITTVAAYLPPILGKFTTSSTLIGLVLAAEGVFAFFIPLIVGPTSDATQTSFGRRRPYMALALLPMALALAAVAFMASFQATAFALFAFFFAYYLYEPPYRGLYPDLLDDRVFGRAQGVQHVFRGAALGGGLVGGGFLLALWEPAPFILAAGVVLVACGAVILFVREDTTGERRYARLRTVLAAPWRVVRRERNVRRFLVANTAWEATFAGMRTFVVLYIIDGLGQPLHVSSVVLAVVAGGYVTAAILSGLFADRFGLGYVILGASWVYGLGLLSAGFAQSWHWWYCALVFPVAVAGGTVMTLSWGLLFKVMPDGDRGTVTGLATTTKGIGLVLGPLAAGAAIDIFHSALGATRGYAALWPTVALPVLLVIPLVALLADAERVAASGATGRETGPAR